MAVREENIKFKRGKSDVLPEEKEAGTLLVETDTGNAYIDDTDSSRIQIKDDTKLPLTGGTMEGDIDMGSNNITTSHVPSNGEDVVNKDYLDSKVVTYEGEEPIEVSGNTISHKEYGENSGGPDSDIDVEFGGSFDVPNITSDNYGHVSSIENKTVTLPKESTEALEMIMSGIAIGFLIDENDNVILSESDTGVILDWSICNCEEVKDELTVEIQKINDIIGDTDISTIDEGTLTSIVYDLYLEFQNAFLYRGSTSISPDSFYNKNDMGIYHYNNYNLFGTGSVSGYLIVISDGSMSVEIAYADDSDMLHMRIGTVSYEIDETTGEEVESVDWSEWQTASSQSVIDDLNQKIKDLETSLSETNTSVSDLKDKVDGINTSVSDIQDDIKNIDDKFDDYLPLSGGTMTGDISMGSNKITTSSTPSSDTDVVNKKYVDDSIPDVPNYTGQDPIEVNGTVISHKSYASQSGGPSSDITPDFGESFTVPSLESDSYGHVTSVTDRNVTLPEESREAIDMLLTGVITAFLTDESGNVILESDDSGIILEWPVCLCPDTITDDEIDDLFQKKQ